MDALRMDTLLNWFWQGLVIAAALQIVLRVIDRAHASVRYAVSWVALAALLILPVVPVIRNAVTSPVAAMAGQSAAAGGSPEAVMAMPAAWWMSGVPLAVAWAAWMASACLRVGRAAWALRLAKAQSLGFPRALESQMVTWSRVRRRGRAARLAVSTTVRAAAVLGGRSPLIVVSPRLLTALQPDELDRVVVHEWTHVQRRDDMATLLQLIVHAIVGWHPAFWLIDRHLQRERENACDERTVALTGSAASYAECLVKIAGLPLAGRDPIAAPGVLAGNSLRPRVTRIVSRRGLLAMAWSRGAACAAAVALMLLCGSLGGQRLVAVVDSSTPALVEQVANRVFMRGSDAALESTSSLERRPVAARDTPMTSVRALDDRVQTSADRAAASRNAAGGGGRTAPDSPTAPGGAVRQSVTVPAVAAAGQAAGTTDQVPVPTDTGGAVSAGPPPAAAPVPGATPATGVLTGSAAPTGSTPAPAPAAAPLPSTPRAPWTAAADAGTAIGRGSRNAGVATAGLFNRFARRVAGSF